MAKIANVYLSFNVNGDGIIMPWTNPNAISNASSPGEHQHLVTINGDNTLTAPTGSTSLIIVPPAASAIVKKLKGNGADTGFPISASVPTFLPLGSGTLILNTSGVETVELYWL